MIASQELSSLLLRRSLFHDWFPSVNEIAYKSPVGKYKNRGVFSHLFRLIFSLMSHLSSILLSFSVHFISCQVAAHVLHWSMTTLSVSFLLLLMHWSVLTFMSRLFPQVVHIQIQSISGLGDEVQFVPIMFFLELLSNFKHFSCSIFLSENASFGTARSNFF